MTVHRRAAPLGIRDAANAGFRQTLLDIYLPRYGPEWETFLDSGPIYARIEPDRMFAFWMPSTRHRFARAGMLLPARDRPHSRHRSHEARDMPGRGTMLLGVTAPRRARARLCAGHGQQHREPR